MKVYKFRTTVKSKSGCEKIRATKGKPSFYRANKLSTGKGAALSIVDHIQATKFGPENWEDLKANELALLDIARGASMGFIGHFDALTGEKITAVILD